MGIHLTLSSGLTSLPALGRRGSRATPLVPWLFAFAIHGALPAALPPSSLHVRSLNLDDGSRRRSILFLDSLASCTTAQHLSSSDFVGCESVGSAISNWWGAVVGSRAWCCDLLVHRVVKAPGLMDTVGRYDDAQGDFCFLLSCTEWATLVYSCRTALPELAPSDASSVTPLS